MADTGDVRGGGALFSSFMRNNENRVDKCYILYVYIPTSVSNRFIVYFYLVVTIRISYIYMYRKVLSE